MSGTVELSETETSQRSRFRVVTLHVLRSAVLLPFLLKYVLFVFLALTILPRPVSVVLWVVGAVAIYRFAMRRSLAALRGKITVSNPDGCIVPAVVAFAGLAAFSVLIDIALASNTVRRPGPFVLLSLLVNAGIFTFQFRSTRRVFAEMPGAGISSGSETTRIRDGLLLLADIAIMVGFVVLVLVTLFAAS